MTSAKPTVAALLKTLRQAPTSSAAIRAVDEAMHLLIATTSLAEAQNLVFGAYERVSSTTFPCSCVDSSLSFVMTGLQQCASTHPHSIELTTNLHTQLQQAAAICTEPISKAEFLGFVLFQQSASLVQTQVESTLRCIVYKTLHTNNNVLSGYLAALTAADGPLFRLKVDMEQALKTLGILSSVMKAVLIDPLQADGSKTTVLNAIASILRHFGDNVSIQTAVTRLLVEALELVPHSQLSQSTYTAHVALIVDTLTSIDTQGKSIVVLAARTARFVLESVQLGIQKDCGVLALLRSLEQLAQRVPQALWCSVFLTSTAYFLVHQCQTFLEHQLMLSVLRATLAFGWQDVSRYNTKRSVYVEILVLPLSSMIQSHGHAASELLHRVIALISRGAIQSKQPFHSRAPMTETAVHAHSAVQLLSEEESCQQWLCSLFSNEDAVPLTTRFHTDKWHALLIVALLSDARPALQTCAGRCLERQVNQRPKFWDSTTTKALVASVLFLVAQDRSLTAMSGPWMTSCLYAVAGLAATTTDTMRVMLCLIDRMNQTVNLQSMAVPLLYQVYLAEARIFPRLEAMLLDSSSASDNLEHHVVRMATIQALCKKTPEAGVKCIQLIQRYLEDRLESVAAMAMEAISALCAGDCLDFYLAYKIIAPKVRKHSIPCATKPLFQEQLCHFYALGGTNGAKNDKQAVKLLDQTWKFVDNNVSMVRTAAYAALNTFSLDTVGHSLPQDSTTELEGTEACLTTMEGSETLVAKIMFRLESEHDANGRRELEKLTSRVIAHEGLQLAAFVGRGPRQRLEQTRSIVSATATKAMKALFPSRAEVQAMARSSTEFSGFLLAYESTSVFATKPVKRKDKLVRLGGQEVDKLLETIVMVLKAVELPWEATSTDASEIFLRTQTFMEGWSGYMATFLTALDELVALKTPGGVDDTDVAFRVFSEQVTGLVTLLLSQCPNTIAGQVAAGALIGQLCTSKHWPHPQLVVMCNDTIAMFSRDLAVSIEQSRVFADRSARSAMIGAFLALQLSIDGRTCGSREENDTLYRLVEKSTLMFDNVLTSTSDDLVAACAVEGLSHLASLYMNGDELESLELLAWRQQRVQPIAKRILAAFLYSDVKTIGPGLPLGDAMFPLCETTGETACVQSVAAIFKPSATRLLLRWASAKGLARLANGFLSIQRADWLGNVQKGLASLYETNTAASMTALALGPVLLHCVYHHLVPSLRVEHFVADCIQRATDAAADTLDRGFLMLSVTYVLCRFNSVGGFCRTTQAQTIVVGNLISKALKDDSATGRCLMLAAVANLFYLSFGMSTLVGAGLLHGTGKVALSLDVQVIAILIHSVRAQIASARNLSCAVLGAVARAADNFYVIQTKKSFEFELRTLSPKSMLSQILAWLWGLTRSSPEDSQRRSQVSVAVSMLRCLTLSGPVLPLWDFTGLLRRVMFRLCSVDASVACIAFAATQASCDEFVANELLSTKWVGNADARLQAALITWVSHAASRMETPLLDRLLTRLFYLLQARWCRDFSSPRSVFLFDQWTAMLRDVLMLKSGLPAPSLEMVTDFVLDQVIHDLSFGPHDLRVVEQFARAVLSQVDYGERGFADTFLMPTGSNSSLWSWWRHGVFFVTLATLNHSTISKREAVLAFQWCLRHRYHEWTDEALAMASLQPLIANLGAVIAQSTQPNETAPLILDVLDAFSHGISARNAFGYAEKVKRWTLFYLMATIVSWSVSTVHEQYQLEHSLSTVPGVDVMLDLLPFGLVMYARGSKAGAAVGERLLALLDQLIQLRLDETVAYVATLRMCSRQLHVAAHQWGRSTTVADTIRDFWSLRE